MTYTYGDKYKANGADPDLTFLVFYREGAWSGSGRRGAGKYSVDMPDRWETAVLRGDDPRWAFWNKSGAREYIIVSTSKNPNQDRHFQQLRRDINNVADPNLLREFFGVTWVESDKLKVADVRHAVARPNGSSRLKLALCVVGASRANVNVRRLAAALAVTGTSQRGVALAEAIARLKLTAERTSEVARTAVTAKVTARQFEAGVGAAREVAAEFIVDGEVLLPLVEAATSRWQAAVIDAVVAA
ncbi:hypothetical protein [Mycolicibacter minnesotensis]